MGITKVILLLSSLILVGCGSTEKNDIYYWGGDSYGRNLYTYMTDGEDVTTQIDMLEKIVNVSVEKGKKVPPGLYAQLGLLYSKKGDLGKSQQFFNLEKTNFPESAKYIQFLQSGHRGSVK